MFGLMKVVTWLLSPLALGLAGLALGGFCVRRKAARRGWALVAFSWVWLWVWSSPWFFFLLGAPLESRYPSRPVSQLPKADAIVLLGGGMGSPTPKTVYPELYPGADRGWQAARVFHAGKAPLILFSGVAEGPGMRQFLMDLGVPSTNIVLESESKNTYENGLFTREKLKALKARKVILVSSAWHLRRAVMTFEALGVQVIPSGCDYEALSIQAWMKPSSAVYFLPSPDFMARNSAIVKERLGYWAYRLYLGVRKKQGAARGAATNDGAT